MTSAIAYPVATRGTAIEVLRRFIKKHPLNSTNRLLEAEIARLNQEQPA